MDSSGLDSLPVQLLQSSKWDKTCQNPPTDWASLLWGGQRKCDKGSESCAPPGTCKLLPIPGQAREGPFPRLNRKKKTSMNLEYEALHVALVGDRDGGTMALSWPESLRPFIPVACLKTTQREDTNYA